MGFLLRAELILFGGPRLPAGTELFRVDVGYHLKEGEATYACRYDGATQVVCLRYDMVEETPVEQEVVIHPSVYLKVIG